MVSDDKPTLYDLVYNPGVPLSKVTIIKSRWTGLASRWWAFRPPLGDEAVHAPTQGRVLEMAEEEWGQRR